MQRFIHAQLAGAVGVAVACALIGCSENPSPSAASSGGIDIASVRACDLLTPEEIEAATGIGARAGEDVGFAGAPPMCNWPREGSDVEIVVTLLVAPGGYRTFDQFLESSRDSAFGDVLGDVDVEAVDVEGAHFGAFIPGAGLQAYGEGFMVNVTAETAAGRDEIGASASLARAAIARLR